MAHVPRRSYFDRFPGFHQDLQLPLGQEFVRLASFQGWTERSNRYVREHGIFLRAQFEEHVGNVERSGTLEGWQALCQELGINPLPCSKTQCKIALATGVHVNIVDLINSRRQGSKVQVFETKAELVAYTKRTGKFFPKARAKKDKLLRILLRWMR